MLVLFAVQETGSVTRRAELIANLCDRVILILENMSLFDLLPDVQISSAVARALSFGLSLNDSAETSVDHSRGGAGPIPAVSAKDVLEAASSKNFNRLKRSVTSESPLTDPFPDHRRRHSSSSSSVSYHSGQRDQYVSAKIVGGGGVINSSSSEGYLSSNRFSTQLRMADRTLDFLYPDLVIDLKDRNGTACPRSSCQRSLSVLEIVRAFPNDSNCYTVKCPYCQMDYVPRFTVFSSLSTWEGSEGRGSPLWCELLSPWVLQKEIMSVVLSTGIETIVSPTFRDGVTNPQYSVLFWNLMVYCRLYGLPYAFLITEKMSLAFLIPLDD
jgi:hypothetical protein